MLSLCHQPASLPLGYLLVIIVVSVFIFLHRLHHRHHRCPSPVPVDLLYFSLCDLIFLCSKINFPFPSSKCAVERMWYLLVDSALAMFCMSVFVFFAHVCSSLYLPAQHILVWVLKYQGQIFFCLGWGWYSDFSWNCILLLFLVHSATKIYGGNSLSFLNRQCHGIFCPMLVA